jgi:hypothetical protein
MSVVHLHSCQLQNVTSPQQLVALCKQYGADTLLTRFRANKNLGELFLSKSNSHPTDNEVVAQIVSALREDRRTEDRPGYAFLDGVILPGPDRDHPVPEGGA